MKGTKEKKADKKIIIKSSLLTVVLSYLNLDELLLFFSSRLS